MSDRKGLLRITGKGRKVREVPVNSETRKYLKEYLKVKPNSPYLFVSQKGGKMERSTILGHEDITTTQRYHRPKKEVEERAVENMYASL